MSILRFDEHERGYLYIYAHLIPETYPQTDSGLSALSNNSWPANLAFRSGIPVGLGEIPAIGSPKPAAVGLGPGHARPFTKMASEESTLKRAVRSNMISV
jgi:hypothetical protein